jgi:hypothetical protein
MWSINITSFIRNPISAAGTPLLLWQSISTFQFGSNSGVIYRWCDIAYCCGMLVRTTRQLVITLITLELQEHRSFYLNLSHSKHTYSTDILVTMYPWFDSWIIHILTLWCWMMFLLRPITWSSESRDETLVMIASSDGLSESLVSLLVIRICGDIFKRPMYSGSHNVTPQSCTHYVKPLHIK